MNLFNSRLLKSLERTLHIELERYPVLPMHLALLYLLTGEDDCSIALNAFPFNVNISRLKNCYVTTFDGEQVLSPELFEAPLPIQLFKNDDFINVWKEFIYNFNFMQTLFSTRVLEPATKKYKKKLKKAIYSRNSTLVNLINNVVDLYNSEEGYVPGHYVLPYLFFNQHKYITRLSFDHIGTLRTEFTSFFTYSHYQPTLKYKLRENSKTHSIVRNQTELLDLYKPDAHLLALPTRGWSHRFTLSHQSRKPRPKKPSKHIT